MPGAGSKGLKGAPRKRGQYRDDKRGPHRDKGKAGGAKPGRRQRSADVRTSAIFILTTDGFGDYALLDSGNGRKLERFGSVVVDRPEPQALWKPRRPKRAWADAHAVFSASKDDDEKGKWRVDRPIPDAWAVEGLGVTMQCRLQGLWHLGLFPEQVAHWTYMLKRIRSIQGRPARVLNLFGYTGAASLIAAAAGAQVTHVDASKKAVQWARDNQAVSGLQDAPIRWIVDDAAKFVARDVRRGKTYDVVLVDPPKFGRGPSGETWDLFLSLPGLLSDVAKLVSKDSGTVVLTVYAIRASVLAFEQLMREALCDLGGAYACGELAVASEGDGPSVPTSLFVRWES